MTKYVIGFIIALLMSSQFVNYQGPPSKIPASVSATKPTTLGVWKRREMNVGEIKVVESAAVRRYSIDVNNKNENRDADLPGMGVN